MIVRQLVKKHSSLLFWMTAQKGQKAFRFDLFDMRQKVLAYYSLEYKSVIPNEKDVVVSYACVFMRKSGELIGVIDGRIERPEIVLKVIQGMKLERFIVNDGELVRARLIHNL